MFIYSHASRGSATSYNKYNDFLCEAKKKKMTFSIESHNQTQEMIQFSRK